MDKNQALEFTHSIVQMANTLQLSIVRNNLDFDEADEFLDYIRGDVHALQEYVDALREAQELESEEANG